MALIHWYFKLFNSIKEEHEVDFAELELQGLFGKVKKVSNFANILNDTPRAHACINTPQIRFFIFPPIWRF